MHSTTDFEINKANKEGKAKDEKKSTAKFAKAKLKRMQKLLKFSSI